MMASHKLLLIEAQEVKSKNGLSPKELLKQRDELLEALQIARRELEMWAEADGLDPYNSPRINDAIARALGENKE